MNTLETVGTIIKKEIIATIEHDTNKALVLETLQPYPGYHGTTIPDQINPVSLFLVTDKKYSGENIIRSTLKVKQVFLENFDATPAQITVFNTLSPCIRIKDLRSYALIGNLVEAYRNNGIEFMKSRKVESFNGLIKVRKYFELEKIEDGLFRDIATPEMAYFTIPTSISWDVFESITHNLKVNPDFANFDAALGIFLPPNNVIDVVRVYREDINMEDVKLLWTNYLKEVKRAF